MRHRLKTTKLQRKPAHRKALISNLIVSLIEHRRIRTTLAKAKALRPEAEKMLTLGKKANAANASREDTKKDTPRALHLRRLAIARLDGNVEAVKKLFSEIAPAHKERAGGYTRITKLGQRRSDAAPMAYIEWMDAPKPRKAIVEAAPAAEAAEGEDKE
jgi:large subunit ribosomal protein L17